MVHVDVEFLIRGQDAAELVNAALSRLEQLNGGPLPAGTVPTISGVKPDSLDAANVVTMWAGVCTALLPRQTEYRDGVVGEGEAAQESGDGYVDDWGAGGVGGARAPDIKGDPAWADPQR